jgi:hypothetical protein
MLTYILAGLALALLLAIAVVLMRKYLCTRDMGLRLVRRGRYYLASPDS